jgi:hypothetical protein
MSVAKSRHVRVLCRAAFYSSLYLVAASLSFLPPVAAQVAADPDARIRQHLDAGEFAPAIALARGLPAGPQRNQMLAAVARAQANAGAPNAALATLHGVTDDRTRSYALDQMAGRPAEGGARGGATQADFDTLIDLITSTISPQSWDTVGGPGAIDSFPTGVYVDASGVMKRIKTIDSQGDLAAQRAAAVEVTGNRDVRRKSQLRKVSLTRLEKQLQMRWALGQPPTEAMKMLAGLHRIRYVFVYPETGDVVIAGPAGRWTADAEGRTVNLDTGEPVLQLDDFVVVLRNALDQGGRFLCSINPRRENLAATQAFLNESAKTPLKPGEHARAAWLARIRETLGKQDIEVQGIDPRTRVARVIVEADYRMKLVGMGLEESVFGVTSYLDSLGGAAAPMNVLRWWFTLNYDAVRATPSRDAFELRGQGAKVLSENEMLTERGERIHTGQSDELNEQFAHSFTERFPALAAKYPIYAELRNVFDLSLVAALIVAEDLPGQVGWHLIHFHDPGRYQVELGPPPVEVDSVINHRLGKQGTIIAQVSGGVLVNTSKYVNKPAITVDNYGALKAEHKGAVPQELPPDAWWWD